MKTTVGQLIAILEKLPLNHIIIALDGETGKPVPIGIHEPEEKCPAFLHVRRKGFHIAIMNIHPEEIVMEMLLEPEEADKI